PKQLPRPPGRAARSPSGDPRLQLRQLLRKHGCYYESSMMGNDHSPYRVRLGDRIELQNPAVFGKESRLIEMPISWSLDDYPHFEFVRTQNAVLPGLKNAGSVLANWIDDFLYMKDATDWGIITYTFHPFVIGRGHRMVALERLIERLAAEGAEFMRMDAAAESFDQRSPYKS